MLYFVAISKGKITFSGTSETHKKYVHSKPELLEIIEFEAKANSFQTIELPLI